MRFIIKHPIIAGFCTAIILNLIPFMHGEAEEMPRDTDTLLKAHLEEDAALCDEDDMIYDLCRWDFLSEDELEDCLRRVAEFEMGFLGMEEDLTLTFEALEPPTLGVYFNREKTIKLDTEYMKKRRMRDTLFTLLHEIYHAYQHYVVENLDFSDILVEKGHYYRQAREWKNNIELGYISPDENKKNYNSQPLERDADKYAEARLDEYLREVRKIG